MNTNNMNDDDYTTPILDLGLDTPVTAIVTEPIPGETINSHAAAKAASEREMIKEFTGLNLTGDTDSGLFFKEGTVMLESGVQTAVKYRQEWDKLPTAAVESARISATVANEDRKDYRNIPLNKLAINGHGLLTGGNGGLHLTDYSWGQMAIQLASAKTAAPRNNFNARLRNIGDKRATLRTRFPAEDKTRIASAVVSDKYEICDGYKVLQQIAAMMPGETRGRVEYDAETTHLRADLTLQNPYEMEDEIAVGRLHRVGIRLDTADLGNRKLTLRAYVERIRCINCTILPHDWANLSVKHMGINDLQNSVTNLLNSVESGMESFAGVWRAAHMVRVFEASSWTADAREAFGKLVDGGFVGDKGMKPSERETLVDNLVTAWSYEPGNSYQAINRAITRAAQSYSLDDSENLEMQAGELLYNRVAVCNEMGW